VFSDGAICVAPGHGRFLSVHAAAAPAPDPV
jgi:hypothetical protein